MNDFEDQKNDLIRNITNKVINMVSNEMNKSEIQIHIRKKIINPLISIIYHELYPYIYALVIVIMMILVFTILILICLIFIYLKAV
jgi:hypothetical protein